ncbi:MAG: Na+/H+ antiporter NhaA, partial [Acidimicrobiia bacterium]|nr:Na+/H+ antiporter NhaA [Acidimicrobiia bacterium]
VPTFALANAGIELGGDAMAQAARSSVTLGIVVGLVVGKTLGIAGSVGIAVWTGLARLPGQSTPAHLTGVCAVAGIGFTVSLFISGLAYDAPAVIEEAKIGILVASLLAAGLGTGILIRAGRPRPEGS